MISLQMRTGLLAFATISCLTAFCQLQAAGQDALPNVVIIISDDQGWSDIGYNNPNVYTPNLDRLAATGATFTQHYVMPQCTPTRVALLTGRYPSRFGPSAQQANNEPAFPLGTPTIAEMFKRRGYKTMLTGKWHLGSSADHGPNHFGFDHSYGSLTGAVGMYDHRYRVSSKYSNTWHRNLKLIEGSDNGQHATDLVANEAVRFIKRRRSDSQPFFLYVPFHSVHTPLDERGQFVDRPTQLDPNDDTRWLDEDQIQWFNDPKGIIQKEQDPEKRLLLAAAYHMDDAIGKMVAALDQAGLRKNTLILFSSDNGPQVSWNGNAYPDDLTLTQFNQKLPMRGKKLDVWEGGIRVPAFANWPGRIDAKKISEPLHIIDWFPTLAKLIDFQPPKSFALDGVDLSSVLFRDQSLPARDLYWLWCNRANRWALRFGDWKIVKYGKVAPEKASDWQLFHLKNDPTETKDLSDSNESMLELLHQRYVVQRSKDHRSR